MTQLRLCCLLLAMAQAPAYATRAPEFALHEGDRVVFYGDSITELKFYTTDVEDYVLTRFPGVKVDFVNSGWASDSVAGGFGGPIDTRLSRDVLAYRPTVVTVMLGMNDGHVKPWSDETARVYEQGYTHILDALKGCRLTLLAPSAYDDVTRAPDFPGGYNGVLLRFGQFVGEQARARGATLVDMNAPLTRLLASAQGIKPELAKMLISDRVHPSMGAQWVMAEALLKGWNAPAWVTKVVIDGTRVAESLNTHVRDVSSRDGGLRWTQQDAVLPLWFDRADERVALALQASDVEAQLNREPLVVKGLSGKFRLAIDGVAAGTFSAAELAKGVELGQLDTPMTRQARQVHQLTLSHQNVRFAAWRGAVVAAGEYGSVARDRAIAAMRALDADLVARQRKAAQPKPHTFMLTPL